MAATVSVGSTQKVTLSATPDVATRLDVANGVRAVEIRFYDAAGSAYVVGKLAATGADGQAVSASHLRIGAGELYERPIPYGGGSVLYVASATASAIVEIAGWGA